MYDVTPFILVKLILKYFYYEQPVTNHIGGFVLDHNVTGLPIFPRLNIIFFISAVIRQKQMKHDGE